MEQQKQQENRAPAPQPAKPTRLQREAEALRDNLAKRKAQTRERQEASKGDPS